MSRMLSLSVWVCFKLKGFLRVSFAARGRPTRARTMLTSSRSSPFLSSVPKMNLKTRSLRALSTLDGLAIEGGGRNRWVGDQCSRGSKKSHPTAPKSWKAVKKSWKVPWKFRTAAKGSRTDTEKSRDSHGGLLESPMKMREGLDKMADHLAHMAEGLVWMREAQ